MPRVRPFGGRFWPSHSACCNANSNCHSTILGSSKYVKFPFHQKHLQKKIAYLEDPGINKDLLLMLLPAKVIYQRTGISKPWNWRLQALLACAWQWGIAQDIASIVFHVAWEIVVKKKSQKSAGNKLPNLKASQLFGLVPYHSWDPGQHDEFAPFCTCAAPARPSSASCKMLRAQS